MAVVNWLCSDENESPKAVSLELSNVLFLVRIPLRGDTNRAELGLDKSRPRGVEFLKGQTAFCL